MDQRAFAGLGIPALGPPSDFLDAMDGSLPSGSAGDPNASTAGVGEPAGASVVAEGEPVSYTHLTLPTILLV